MGELIMITNLQIEIALLKIKALADNISNYFKSNIDDPYFCALISIIVFFILYRLYRSITSESRRQSYPKNGCANFKKEYDKGYKKFLKESQKRELLKDIKCPRCGNKYSVFKQHCITCGEINPEFINVSSNTKINHKNKSTLLFAFKISLYLIVLIYTFKYILYNIFI
jgi:ribosomal protein L37E